MKFMDSFSQGIELYAKNFKDFVLLSISRMMVGVVFLLFALLLTFPLIFLEGLVQTNAYSLFYVITIVAVGIFISPFFMFPLVSGVLDRLSKKKISLRQAFTKVKDNYVPFLFTSLIFSVLIGIILLQGVLMSLISPIIGMILMVICAYIAIRLSFWDIMVFKGEKKPLRASWEVTEKNSFQVFATLGFILLFMMGISSFSAWMGLLSDSSTWIFIWGIMDTFIWILIPPLIVAPRVILASTMIKELNKKQD